MLLGLLFSLVQITLLAEIAPFGGLLLSPITFKVLGRVPCWCSSCHVRTGGP
jgi:hypothetical protein